MQSRLLATAMLAVALLVGQGCVEHYRIIFINNSDQQLTVSEGGSVLGDCKPMSVASFETIDASKSLRLQVRIHPSNERYSFSVSGEDLKARTSDRVIAIEYPPLSSKLVKD